MGRFRERSSGSWRMLRTILIGYMYVTRPCSGGSWEAHPTRVRIESCWPQWQWLGAGGRLVAVFVLALAVVGMHSLGAGHHHGATTTVGHGSHPLTGGGRGRGRRSSACHQFRAWITTPPMWQRRPSRRRRCRPGSRRHASGAWPAKAPWVPCAWRWCQALSPWHYCRPCGTCCIRPALTLPAWARTRVTPRFPRRIALHRSRFIAADVSKGAAMPAPHSFLHARDPPNGE